MTPRRKGNVYIEYLLLAAAVTTATLAFFANHLSTPGTGARGDLENAFETACKQVAKTDNC